MTMLVIFYLSNLELG